MNRVICPKGHFYDGDKYSSCPHCLEGVEPATPDPFIMAHNQEVMAEKEAETAQKEKKGFFHKKKGKEKDIEKQVVVDEVVKTEYLYDEENENSEIDISSDDSANKSVDFDLEDKNFTGKSVNISFGAAENKPVEVEKSYDQSSSRSVSPSNNGSNNSMLSRVAAASTMSSSSQRPSDEGKTIGFYSAGNTEPPVGYLICVKGEDFGMGFALKSGNNSIGRSQSMDVVITDPKVSRERQAIIMYDPMNRDFYLKPGEANGLCYLNGAILLEIKKLAAYDKILLGDSILLFFPLCGDNFTWDEYL